MCYLRSDFLRFVQVQIHLCARLIAQVVCYLGSEITNVFVMRARVCACVCERACVCVYVSVHTHKCAHTHTPSHTHTHTHTHTRCIARTPLGHAVCIQTVTEIRVCYRPSVINTYLRGNTQVHPSTFVCTSDHTIFSRPIPTTYRFPGSTLGPGYINS